MARKLKTIAKWINENTEFKAAVRETIENTDRTPEGCCYITSPGKGRKGFIIEVRNKDNQVIYKHNSAETYKTNEEVERWLQAGMPKQPPDNWRDRHYA